ncbi:MAG: hypothetical protein RBU30_20695 [Polyangia bacterium]|nr:hypothetical protein [Polyangia bacterium]
MHPGPSRTPGSLATFGLWLLALLICPAMTCPSAPPPPTLPLPDSADPPASQELRVQAVGGAGSDEKGSYYAGGALRGSYAPLRGMLVGVEIGGGARHNSPPRTLPNDRRVDKETAISGRLFVGYGLWLYPQILSLAAEGGLTPGLHSELGSFLGTDLTISATAGGRRLWALTAGYRLAYMIPSRDSYWSPVLYHLGALTLQMPRRARYSGFLQLGLHFGHRLPDEEKTLGLQALAGFRFAWGN